MERFYLFTDTHAGDVHQIRAMEGYVTEGEALVDLKDVLLNNAQVYRRHGLERLAYNLYIFRATPVYTYEVKDGLPG